MSRISADEQASHDSELIDEHERDQRSRAQALPGLLLSAGLGSFVLAYETPRIVRAIEFDDMLSSAVTAVIIMAVIGLFTRMRLRTNCLVAIGVFLLGVSGPLWPDAGLQAPSSSRAYAAPDQATALEKMEAVFEGAHSRHQIGVLMDATMSNLGVAPTEAARESWGSVLVTLRKSDNIPEMSILRCVHAMGPQQMQFPAAAAICSTMLSNN